jgi:hypothetical protein
MIFRIKLIVILGLLGAPQLFAHDGDTLANKYALTITAQSLKAHLEILASDDFEGRETGKVGQKKAAEYIANQFMSFGLTKGLDSTYFQTFQLVESGIASSTINVNDTKLRFLEEFYFFNGMSRLEKQNFTEVHFLGYGIDDSTYSDYRFAVDKVEHAVIWQGEPQNEKGMYLISGDDKKSVWSKDFGIKLAIAKSKGIKTLFIINEDFKNDVKRYGYYLKSPKVGLKKEINEDPEMSVYFISPEAASVLLGKSWNSKKVKTGIAKRRDFVPVKSNVSVSIEVIVEENVIESENVLGIIEGTDLKDEFVVITAHYDHLGKKGNDVYNGADDDGSGTTAILEIGRALAQAKKDGHGPRRSVLIMPVSGEEKGLLGSEFYAANPVFPLNKTVANLNVDMIGRTDDQHKDNNRYVYLIGSNRLSTNLHYLSERVNADCCGLFLDYTYNDPNDPNRFYYRSDHYNFIKNGVPAIFYFSGVHEDYHKPTDIVDKIEFDKMTEITRLIYRTALEIANTEVDLTPDVVSPEEE